MFIRIPVEPQWVMSPTPTIVGDGRSYFAQFYES